ncbi:MAG: hypothetical protein IJD06_06945, partial [Clostridia bacterium]|nr:hypothetical protein [Clostridia bacterium]
LYPYYQRDLAEGRITREEMYYLLQCFLHKTDLHAHFNEQRKTFDNGVSVMIGGCDPEGNPVYNEITDMVIDAYRENRLINPKLNARAGSYSSDAYLRRLAQLIRCGNNNIVVENDDYIVPMFQRMGLSPEDARTYVGNGCQEVICRNQLHSRAFVYINTVQVLLDTLYPGEDGETAFRQDTFEELYASFFSNLRALIGTVTDTFAPYERMQSSINPEPMLSAFTADCVLRGMDMTEGGARYYHKTFSLVGFGTLCDSLLRLRDAYAQGSVRLLREAVQSDFSEQEKLRRQLQSSPHRFGYSEEADEFARKLAQDLALVSRGIVNGQGIEWGTSLFTYHIYHSFGRKTAATPDGRHAGESLSRQMNMASLPALTDAARSMAALTEAPFQDVGMFDFSLPYTVSDREQMTDALTQYIRTCLEYHIPVLQTNTADRQTMLEEYSCKGSHPELVVRVCGYSALFGQLPADTQREIIARSEG